MNIALKSICKKFGNKSIFNNFSMNINGNDSISILGESGRGKSTLLNIIGLLDRCDSGEIIVDGIDISDKSFDRTKYMRENVGYLFQNYALVDNLTVDENLNIALAYTGVSKKKKEEIKEEALNKVKLSKMKRSKVYALSGGEQQRLSIARLLIKPCELILADEPTGALDDRNKENIINLLMELKNNKSIILVTHDKTVSQICNQTICLDVPLMTLERD